MFGPQGFNELATALPGRISRAVLSDRLHRLETLGLVGRADRSARQVPYRLTTAGEGLLPTLLSLRGWAATLPCPPASASVAVLVPHGSSRDGLYKLLRMSAGEEAARTIPSLLDGTTHLQHQALTAAHLDRHPAPATAETETVKCMAACRHHQRCWQPRLPNLQTTLCASQLPHSHPSRRAYHRFKPGVPQEDPVRNENDHGNGHPGAAPMNPDYGSACGIAGPSQQLPMTDRSYRHSACGLIPGQVIRRSR
jgi:hypothetical protein